MAWASLVQLAAMAVGFAALLFKLVGVLRKTFTAGSRFERLCCPQKATLRSGFLHFKMVGSATGILLLARNRLTANHSCYGGYLLCRRQ